MSVALHPEDGQDSVGQFWLDCKAHPPPTIERGPMPGKKKKRATKKSGAKHQELRQSLSDLRAQLTKTEKKLTKANKRAERWKKEAKAQESSAARAGAQTEKLRQERSEAVVAPAPAQADAKRVAVPDESWTVAQLRAEARARGLSGMSNKPKAHLLDALS